MTLQMPLFEPSSDWKPPVLSELPTWKGCQRIGYDLETCDPELKKLGPGVRRGGFICGFSFAIEDGPSYYLPIRHLAGDNMDPEHVIRYIADQARDYDGTLVTANGNYDLEYSAEAGIFFPCLKTNRDVLTADPLINELHFTYSLEAVCDRWGFGGKDERLLREAAVQYGVDPKRELWKIPGRFAAQYAMFDAAVVLPINRMQEREIEEQDIWGIYNLETELQPVLLKMRRRGVKIDLDALDRVEAWSTEQEREVLAEIKHLSGETIKLGAIMTKPPLVRALEKIGVKLPKTPKGQPKLDKFVLEGIDHPLADLIRRARQMSQLRSTFASSIRRHLTNGRIHCTFNQLPNTESGEEKGARFGRMSSSHPNLQQQPKRQDYASMWRAIYVPDYGLWLSADYSQQEPRWLTHFAEESRLPMAALAAERYRTDPLTDNHQMTAEICGIDRAPAKEIFLGYCYGMGGAKLARKLGLPTEWREDRQGKPFEGAGPEAQALMDRFNARTPYVRRLAKLMEAQAARDGFILTILGRRCRFPRLPDGSFDWTNKALNRRIQGSSADQMKRAMVEIDRAGLPLQLQVHDEADTSIHSPEEAQTIKEIMMECVPANLPFKVDLKTGPNWGAVA